MFYFPHTHFESAVAESRRKHVPLFFELQLTAETPSMYYEAGPLSLFVTAGELNKCRKVDLDPAMMRKLGVGKIFRMSGKDSNNVHLLFKLYYQPSRGWSTRASKKEPRIEQVFDVPEDTFIRWIVDDASNIWANERSVMRATAEA